MCMMMIHYTNYRKVADMLCIAVGHDHQFEEKKYQESKVNVDL